MLNALRKRTQDDQGFTLIELMVVVLIIAILIAIAIPTFLGLRQRAQDRAAQSDLRNGLTAGKAFYTDAETYTGFDDAEGDAIEPSLEWTSAGGLDEDTVDIVEAADNVVTLQTLSQSEASFCIADNATVGTVRGTDPDGGAFADFAACDGAADW